MATATENNRADDIVCSQEREVIKIQSKKKKIKIQSIDNVF